MYEQTVIQSVVTLAGLIGLAVVLRRLGVIQAEHSSLFARLVTQVTLPALIFLSLARQQLTWDQASLALAMMLAEGVCLAAAWGAAGLLRLPARQKGAFLLAVAFASSTLLGYPLVRQIFPNNAQAMPDAVITSELGVGTLIFTVGALIAIHYGSAETRGHDKLKIVLRFFVSPVFLALVAGIAASVMQLPADNPVVSVLFGMLQTLGGANTILVALVIGAMLEIPNLRSALPMVAAAIVIKLLLQPAVAWLAASSLGFPNLWAEVLVLEAAMPSAILSAVFARRFGCDATLASLLIVTTLVASMLTLVLFLSLMA